MARTQTIKLLGSAVCRGRWLPCCHLQRIYTTKKSIAAAAGLRDSLRRKTAPLALCPELNGCALPSSHRKTVRVQPLSDRIVNFASQGLKKSGDVTGARAAHWIAL